MAVRAIDAIELQKRMCALCNQDYADEPCEPSDCIFIRALNETPTLTQPNEPTYPCDLCVYNPPSSLGGKPCTFCPATGRLPEGEEETP